MKKIVLVLLLSLVLLAGCGSSVEPLHPLPLGKPPVDVRGGSGDYVVQAFEEDPYHRDHSGAPKETWICPGKVPVWGMFPGARVEYPLDVHNGGEAGVFVITCEPPAKSDGTYLFPPDGFEKWLSVSESSFRLGADEVHQVVVVLEIPASADISDSRWEFDVVAMPESGNIVHRVGSRWLVNMAEES